VEFGRYAIKFTPSGGAITLTSPMIANNSISLNIRDTGIGIPKEQLPHLFLEFKRLKRSANIDGTGLGFVYRENHFRFS
jgi:signal transduction histidine kinase